MTSGDAQTVDTSPAEGGQSRASGLAGGRLAATLAGLSRATLENPVLVKEFRTRMRGTRAYWLLLGYTLLLAGVLAMMYFAFEADAASRADHWSPDSGSRAARDLGRTMYYFVFIAQALMVALITPAITAGAVTIEREQRSYELLVTTPLRPVDIIRGKLIAAVAFVVLLLTASLPLVSLSFLAGGVSPMEVFASYLLIGLSALVYGALGIFWSASLRTTAAATITTYLTVLALGLLSFVPGVFAAASGAVGPGGEPGIPFQSVNPVTAALNCVKPEWWFAAQVPTWISAAILNLLLGLLVAVGAMSRLEHFEPPRPVWTRLLSTLLWIAFCVFLFAPVLGQVATTWTTAQNLQASLGGFLVSMLVLGALVTPIFNTGDLVVRRGESAVARYLSGFSPHRMFAADLSCGLPLVLLWVVFLLALLPLGVHLAGKGNLLNPWTVYVPALVMCLAVIFGLAGMGNALSVFLPSRWAACVLTYLVGVVLMLLPYLTLIPYYQSIARTRAVQAPAQLLYLVPFESLHHLVDPAGFTTQRPALLFQGAVPNWLVTTVIYAVIGAVCFFFTLAKVRQADARLQREMEAREAAFILPEESLPSGASSPTS